MSPKKSRFLTPFLTLRWSYGGIDLNSDTRPQSPFSLDQQNNVREHEKKNRQSDRLADRETENWTDRQVDRRTEQES